MLYSHNRLLRCYLLMSFPASGMHKWLGFHSIRAQTLARLLESEPNIPDFSVVAIGPFDNVLPCRYSTIKTYPAQQWTAWSHLFAPVRPRPPSCKPSTFLSHASFVHCNCSPCPGVHRSGHV
ncbi:hypothetical protein RSAG8_07828, partial [Rhizoctonia solani AG-8 WAC10335]